MTQGVFPRWNAGTAADADCASPSLDATCQPKFYRRDCTSRIDGESLNAIISEIVAFINARGIQYDCSRLDNMGLAAASIEADIADVAIDTAIAQAAADAAQAAADAVADRVDAGDWKPASHAATTAPLPACTYSNGAAGVGATLTATANGALAAQDGVTLTAGQVLLVKDQVSGFQNGLYTVTAVGNGGSPFVLTRHTEANNADKITAGMAVTVIGGTVNGKTIFALTTATSPVVVGTTALVFEVMGVPSSVVYTASDIVNVPGGGVSATTVQAAIDELDAEKASNAAVAAAQAAADAVADRVDAGDWKPASHAATTAPLPACTYSNGAAGVGATLTATANGALAAQDGVTLTAGQVLLVKDQVSGFQNGLYTVTAVGNGGSPFVLTRHTEANNADKITAGMAVTVIGGTVNGKTIFALTTATSPVVVGTTVLVFEVMGASPAVSPSMPVGAIFYFGGRFPPTGSLKANGALVSRATFVDLWNALHTKSTVTITSANPGVVTWPAHGLIAGDTVRFYTTGALPTNLIANTTYYVISAGLTTDTFRVSATLGGSAINTTAGAQSGTHTAVNAPHGYGDGSTTFPLPERRGEHQRGWDDGRGVDTGRVLGSYQADELKAHTHAQQANTMTSASGGGTWMDGVGGTGRVEGGTTGSTGGTETRGRNYADLVCIKY